MMPTAEHAGGDERPRQRGPDPLRVLRFHSPATAKANGTIIDANPVKSVGGWIVIQEFWRRSLRPLPSAGT